MKPSSAAPGTSAAHLNVRFADQDRVYYLSPHDSVSHTDHVELASALNKTSIDIDSEPRIQKLNHGRNNVVTTAGRASFSGQPNCGRIITKAVLLEQLAAVDAAADAVGPRTVEVANANSVGAVLNFSNQGGTYSNLDQQQQIQLQLKFLQQQQQHPAMASKYQAANNVPPQVDARGGRVVRITADNVLEAAVAAVRGAGKAETPTMSALRRRNSSRQRARRKQSSVCAVLIVLLMLIIPTTIVVVTITNLSLKCRIWLDAPILLLVIGLCLAVIAFILPLLLFRLIGWRCLEDLISVSALAIATVVLSVVIVTLLLVITGAMLFHPEPAEQIKACGLFMKKFITASVVLLWFFIAILLLIFCCDVIMS